MKRPKSVKNTKGSALLFLLPISGIMMLGLLALLNLSGSARFQVVVFQNQVRYHELIESVLDYTQFGMKSRWCFTPALTKENPESCNLGHPGSIDSMLLSQQSLQSIKDYLIQNSKPIVLPTVRDEMKFNFRLEYVSTEHPIYRAIKNLSQEAVKDVAVEVLIQRKSGELYPRRGTEALFQVRVTLSTTGFFFKKNSQIYGQSMVLVSPRELGFFSLIVPRNMDLNAANSVSAVGDFNIKPNITGKGIRFESPIFINHDIILPSSSAKGSAHFSAPIVVGGRVLESAGSAHKPLSNGGPEQTYYHQLPQLTGLAEGIEFEEEPDLGLDRYINSTVTGAQADDMMLACRELNITELDLGRTSQSDLLVKQIDKGSDFVDFEIALTGNNHFVEQRFFPRKEKGNGGSWIEFGTRDASFRLKTTIFFRMKGHLESVQRYVTLSLGRESNYSGEMTTGRTLNIKVSPIYDRGVLQLHRIRIRASVEDTFATTEEIHFDAEAYDLGYFAGANRRLDKNGNPLPAMTSSGHSRVARFEYKKTPGIPTSSFELATPKNYEVQGYFKSDSDHHDMTIHPYPMDEFSAAKLNFGQFKEACQQKTAGVNTSFGSLPWDQDQIFLESTRNSWNFAEPSMEQVGQYPAVGPEFVMNSSAFFIRGIVSSCRIPSTVNFVAGFLVCDQLTIDARTTPLLVVGTLIVGKVQAADSAIANGITFRSIYHEDSISELRDRGLLKKFDGTTCPVLDVEPIWHPELSVVDTYNLLNCGASGLRQKADPFRWTQVLPECGAVPGAASVICLRKPRRLTLLELSRKVDLR